VLVQTKSPGNVAVLAMPVLFAESNFAGNGTFG
jgi:hypothetical protein